MEKTLISFFRPILFIESLLISQLLFANINAGKVIVVIWIIRILTDEFDGLKWYRKQLIAKSQKAAKRNGDVSHPAILTDDDVLDLTDVVVARCAAYVHSDQRAGTKLWQAASRLVGSWTAL